MPPLLLRPKRPYKSLIDFRNQIIWTSGAKKFFEEHPTKWPCVVCDGIGTVKDPANGYEQDDRVSCRECDGTRWWTRERFAAEYHKRIAAFRKALEEYETIMALRRSGLAKLTLEEGRALGLL